MSIERAQGAKVTILFDGKRCVHARECVTGAPKTFLANVEGPWLHPDETPADRLVEIAHRCPSGAIAYRRHDGQPDEAPPPVNVGHIRENGPIAMHGDLMLNGAPIGYRATLCRCGASKNKPFCDGSHTPAGFAASGEPSARKTEALAARDGVLALTTLKDGPLKVEGNLELCTGTGGIVERATQMFLCRCGASKTKPFCDGSHKAIGFAAD
jgi:CDGSH-type Zn-finger protein/uncharacterized Fe-S cluster protein YjdI